MFKDGAWYPDPMPTPTRLANGAILGANSEVIPFAASCPPDTEPDPKTMTCRPSPGARNVNYECGGALAPLGSPGCIPGVVESPMPAIPAPVQGAPLVWKSAPLGWPVCGGRLGEKNEIVRAEIEATEGNGGWLGCLLFACVITGLVRAATGGRS